MKRFRGNHDFRLGDPDPFWSITPLGMKLLGLFYEIYYYPQHGVAYVYWRPWIKRWFGLYRGYR